MLVLPLPSVATKILVVMPTGKVAPLVSPPSRSNVAEQLSS